MEAICTHGEICHRLGIELKVSPCDGHIFYLVRFHHMPHIRWRLPIHIELMKAWSGAIPF